MMPAIVTVSLSAGSKALAAKKVLVKRLVAIEDLGNIEILFTDKTGTLTEGVITFERAWTPTGRRAIAHSCSGSCATKRRSPTRDRSEGTRWTRPCGPPPARLRERRSPPRPPPIERLGVLPFDHERQLASVLVKDPSGGHCS